MSLEGKNVNIIVPKRETQADQFLAEYPDFDGRGVTVGILDTGISPGIYGLQKTRMLDYIDCTSSGDVKLLKIDIHEDASKIQTIKGISGRILQIPENLLQNAESLSKGLLVLSDIIPPALRSRYLKSRKEKLWLSEINQFLKKLQIKRDQCDTQNGPVFEDLEEQIKILNKLRSKEDDPGMICDCIVWRCSFDDHWKAIIDTSETGNLSECKVVGDYNLTGDIGIFSAIDMLSYTVKIDCDTLSVICDSGSHGSHVAAICAGNAGDNAMDPCSDRQGVAPGASLISCKIGDPKLESMESGIAFARAIGHCIERKVDIINYSYGESSVFSNVDCKLQSLLSSAVNENGIIFVSSCGNDGPGLSSMGAPGGTYSDILGVEAYLSEEMAKKMYYTIHDSVVPSRYEFSSRGPTKDGWLGGTVSAPGAAIASIPCWCLSCAKLMNGTSMSSPNAAGCIALLLSALKASKTPYTPYSIKRALMNTVAANGTPDAGLIQILDAFMFHKKMPLYLNHVDFQSTVQKLGHFENLQDNNSSVRARGIYVRNVHDCHASESLRYLVTIKPKFFSKSNNIDYASQNQQINFSVILSVVPSSKWISCTDQIYLSNETKSFEVQIDLSELDKQTVNSLHFARIDFKVKDEPDLGIVHSLPVTVIRPEPLRSTEFRLFSIEQMKKGQLHRSFLTIPSFVLTLTVKISLTDIKAENTGSFSQYLLSVAYLNPNQKTSSTPVKQAFELSPSHSNSFTMDIRLDGASHVIEICLCKSWKYGNDPSNIFCDIVVSTLRTKQRAYTFQSSEPFTEISLLSGECRI